MPRLTKDQKERLHVDLMKGESSIRALAKKYKVANNTILDHKKKLEHQDKKALVTIQNHKEAELVKTKTKTIQRRIQYLEVLDERISIYSLRLKAWIAHIKKGTKPVPPYPFSVKEEKEFTSMLKATETFLSGIDKAEGIADTLININQDQRQVHIHQDSRLEGEWSLLCEKCKKILSDIYLSQRR